MVAINGTTFLFSQNIFGSFNKPFVKTRQILLIQPYIFLIGEIKREERGEK